MNESQPNLRYGCGSMVPVTRQGCDVPSVLLVDRAGAVECYTIDYESESRCAVHDAPQLLSCKIGWAMHAAKAGSADTYEGYSTVTIPL